MFKISHELYISFRSLKSKPQLQHIITLNLYDIIFSNENLFNRSYSFIIASILNETCNNTFENSNQINTKYSEIILLHTNICTQKSENFKHTNLGGHIYETLTYIYLTYFIGNTSIYVLINFILFVT